MTSLQIWQVPVTTGPPVCFPVGGSVFIRSTNALNSTRSTGSTRSGGMARNGSAISFWPVSNHLHFCQVMNAEPRDVLTAIERVGLWRTSSSRDVARSISYSWIGSISAMSAVLDLDGDDLADRPEREAGGQLVEGQTIRHGRRLAKPDQLRRRRAAIPEPRRVHGRRSTRRDGNDLDGSTNSPGSASEVRAEQRHAAGHVLEI